MSDQPTIIKTDLGALGNSEGCEFLGCGGMIFLILLGYAILKHGWPW